MNTEVSKIRVQQIIINHKLIIQEIRQINSIQESGEPVLDDLENVSLLFLHQYAQTHHVAVTLLKCLSYLKNNQLSPPVMVKKC